MVVDDESIILDTSQEILENHMTMPQMTGNELSAQILKLRKDMPVILCTGFSKTMSEVKAASLGIKGFLFKPITMRNLCLKVRGMLDVPGN